MPTRGLVPLSLVIHLMTLMMATQSLEISHVIVIVVLVDILGKKRLLKDKNEYHLKIKFLFMNLLVMSQWL